MAQIIKFPTKPTTPANPEQELLNRHERIVYSLQRINDLMKELKKLSKEGSDDVGGTKRQGF